MKTNYLTILNYSYTINNDIYKKYRSNKYRYKSGALSRGIDIVHGGTGVKNLDWSERLVL